MSEPGYTLYVPDEIWDILFQMLDFRAVAALGTSCRIARKVMRAQKRLVFGHVFLSPMQASITARSKLMPNASKGKRHYYAVQAPVGFGKTITGLSFAFADPTDPNLYVYFVPPKAFDTWIRDVDKVFGNALGVGPGTRVLFAHSSAAAHTRLIKGALETYRLQAAQNKKGRLQFKPSVRAIITTTTSKIGKEVVAKWGTRIVIDEAHAMTDRTWLQVGRFRWLALLSANEVKLVDDGTNVMFDRVVVSTKYMEGSVPLVEVHRSLVEPYKTPYFNEARQFTIPNQKIASIANNLVEYLEALTAIFAQVPNGQIALFLPDGDTGDAIADALPGIAIGWELVPFVNATTKIRYFESLVRSVLVIRLNKSEAITILASAFIIVRPDWINPIRYMQMIGRGLRSTNTNKQLDVHLIVPRGVPALRAAFYEAVRRLMADDLELPIPDHRASEFEKADAALRVCGSSLDRAAPSEVVAAIGVGFDNPELTPTILGLWEKEAAPTIALDQMRALLGLHPPMIAPEAAMTDCELDELLGF
jgi:superfamily II DNA or RNA helicase